MKTGSFQRQTRSKTKKNSKITEEIVSEAPEKTMKSSGRSKVAALKEKISQKYDEKIEKSISNMKNQKVTQARTILKELILSSKTLGKSKCIGYGNRENWYGYYPKGGSQWFLKLTFTKELSKNPFDLLSICFMIQLELKTVKIQQVEQDYAQISQHFEGGQYSYECFMGLGNAYYNSYLHLKAGQQYLKALQINKSERVYEYLGWVKGKWFDQDDQAVEYCQLCLKINPKNRGANYMKSVCHHDVDQIEELLRNLSEKQPQYYRLYFSIAEYCSDEDQEIKQCEKALFYDPSFVQAEFYKMKRLKNRDKRKAQALQKRLMKKYQKNALFWFSLAEQTWEQDTETAKEYYHKCLERNPEHFGAMKSLGVIFEKESNYSLALYYYEHFVELHPYDCEIFNSLGIVCDEIEEKQKAITYYKKAIDLKPDYFAPLLNLGESYQSLENYSEAKKYYSRANEVKQEANICYGLAICCRELGQIDEVEYWAELCGQLGGDDDGQLNEFYGDFYFQNKNDPKTSLDYYLKYSIEKQELNTEYIKQNLINKLDREKALQILEQCLTEAQIQTDNIFLFLELGRLFVHLDDIEHAGICFSHLQNFQENGVGDYEEVNEELNRFFGDKENGFYCLLDRKKLDKKKQEFLSVFEKIYK